MIELSVIIPAYNCAKFVETTISSVLSQKDDRCEIIVINDGSTDNTADVLSSFDGKISVLNQTNAGPSAARNAGIEQAKGQWLAFLDADDFWLPTFYTQMINAASNAKKETAVISSGWQHVDSSGKQKLAEKIPPSEINLANLLQRNAFPPSAALFKRDCVEQVGNFDVNIRGHEDWDLCLRLLAHGFKFEIVPQVLVAYRESEASLSRHLEHMHAGAMQTLEKLFAMPELPASIKARKTETIGTIELGSAIRFYEAGLEKEGFSALVNALAKYPVLLTMLDTYYAIACAKQPRPVKGTGKQLDIESAQMRITAVLQHVLEISPSLPVRDQHLAAALAHLTIGELAYQQRNQSKAFSEAIQSVIKSPSKFVIKRGIKLALRSIFSPNNHTKTKEFLANAPN